MNMRIEQNESSRLIDSALKLRQKLNNSSYDTKDLMKIFKVCNISEYLIKDNQSNCDVGSETNIKTKKLYAHSFGRYGR